MEKRVMKIWLVLSYNLLFSESTALENSQDLLKTPAIMTTTHPEIVLFSFVSHINWYVRNSYDRIDIFISYFSHILFDGNMYRYTCHNKIVDKVRFLYLICDATRFNIILITRMLNYFDSVLF